MSGIKLIKIIENDEINIPMGVYTFLGRTDQQGS